VQIPGLTNNLILRESRINPVTLNVFMGLENSPRPPSRDKYLTVTHGFTTVYAPAEHIK
jgi:hypothetical protein